MKMYDFNIAKELLKAGIIMRRYVWGIGCFVYYNKQQNRYYTNTGSTIILNERTYKNTNDWVNVKDHIQDLEEQFYDVERKYNKLKNTINYLKMNFVFTKLNNGN